MAASEKVIDIRQLSSQDEFVEAVQLQKEIWHFADIELLPVRFFVVADKIGGHVIGAYHEDRMVGFCLAIPGVKPGGRPYLHSHMLGVLPEYGNYGIGRRLKLLQREDAIRRGVELIEWTFDPLELKNAYFNIERLGAVIRRYVENQYGTTSSPLHGGLPTDRCIAEWWVSSPRVDAMVNGAPPPIAVLERIVVPADVEQIRRNDTKRAREIQRGIASQFHQFFDRGLVVLGFERGEKQGAYLLGEL